MNRVLAIVLFFCWLSRGQAQTLDITKDAWKADIQYLKEQLPQTHIDAFHRITAETFSNRATQLFKRVDDLDGDEIVVELMQFLAQIGDGNTRLVWEELRFKNFPMRFRYFGDTLRVVAADSLNQRWLGLQVLKINQFTMPEVQEKLLTLIPADESSNYAYYLMGEYLSRPEILYACGLLQQRKNVVMMYEDKKGNRFKAPLFAQEDQPQHWFQAQEEAPAHFTPPYDALYSGFWINTLAEQNTAYVFAGDYPSDKKIWKSTLKQLKTKLKQNPSTKALIDLRQNAGDNYKAGKQMIKIVAKSAEDGLYIALGRQTYAAAVADAWQWKQKYDAVLLGEESGANLNGYRLNKMIRLPNSGIRISVPTKQIQLIEGHTGGLAPDHQTPSDWERYHKGIDPALERMFNF